MTATEDYRAYMASDEWFARRAQALRRSGQTPKCEWCGISGTSYKNPRSSLDSKDRKRRVEHANGLNVHHVTYKRLGNETPDDLIVLCEGWLHWLKYDSDYGGCHERAHNDPDFARAVADLARSRL